MDLVAKVLACKIKPGYRIRYLASQILQPSRRSNSPTPKVDTVKLTGTRVDTGNILIEFIGGDLIEVHPNKKLQRDLNTQRSLDVPQFPKADLCGGVSID